jgi:putative ABC transport system permease protein
MSWAYDLLHASRTLRRRPALVLTAVASLALGIGANSAIFSVVDAVLLKPLPFPDSERLRIVAEFREGQPSGSNPARLRDWDTQLPGIEGATGFYGEGVIQVSDGEPRRIRALRFFGRPFSVFAMQPALGRAFTPAEERGEGEPVAILTHGYWQRMFTGETWSGTRTLTLSGVTYTIIGVMPATFTYPEDVDVLTPGPAGVQATPRSAGFLQVIVRRKPGVSDAQLQSQVDSAATQMARDYPNTDNGRSARVRPVLDDINSDARTPLLALMGAVGFVLLIACVNLSGLLLARAVERRRESAIRSALGVSRSGLIRLYLAESLLLAAAGGVAGILLGAYGLDLMKKILPAGISRLSSATLDWRVMVFAAFVTLLCGILSGLAPAWQASRASVTEGLRDANAASSGVTRSRARRALVTAQVALSMILLAGAAMLAGSLLELRKSPLGFQPSNVVTLEIAFPWDSPKDQLDEFNRAALERFAAIPGVTATGWADRLPLEGGTQSGDVRVRGKEVTPQVAALEVYRRGATAGYFAAMRIPLLRGRLFAERENVREVVVNETLARALFGTGNPIGQSIAFPDRASGELRWNEITGVVADVRQSATGPRTVPEAWLPMQRVYWPLASFAIRSSAPAAAVISAARDAVRQIDRNLVIDRIATMEQKVELAREEPSVRTWLVSGFAIGALLISLIGLYGMVAGELAQRRREFAVRMALGAGRADIFRTGLRAGLLVTAAGAAIGLAASIVAFRSATSLMAALLLCLAAAAACIRPALRAAHTDPARALRDE